jgi:hypothetical protein
MSMRKHGTIGEGLSAFRHRRALELSRTQI